MYLLKYVVVLLGIFALSLAENDTDIGVLDIPEECLAEYGPLDNLKSELQKMYTQPQKIAKNVQCILFCTLQHHKFIGEDLKIDANAIIDSFLEAKIEKMFAKKLIREIEGCKQAENPADDECLAVTKFINCVFYNPRL